MNKNIIQFIVDENGQYISIPVGRVKATSNLTTRIQLITPITASVAVNYVIYDSKNIQKKQYLIPTGDLGSAVIDPNNPNYQLVAGWKVYEADIYAPILSVISKYKTGKVGMSFEFVEQVPNALCTNFVDYFGFTKPLPQTANNGDYFICEDYNFWLNDKLYNKGDILAYYDQEWHNGGIIPKGLSETVDISVDPAISYPTEEVDETAFDIVIGEIAEDVAELNTRLNGVETNLNDKQDKVDALLETTDKTVVGAINKLNSDVNTLDSQVTDLYETKQNKTDNDLNTTSKTVVGAINELNTHADITDNELTNLDDKINNVDNKVDNVDNKVELIIPKANGAVRFDITQTLSDSEKSRARTNIGIAGGGKIDMIIVSELPEVGEPGTIYLLPNESPESSNLYTEWIYINEVWEMWGVSSIDLSDYISYTQEDSNAGKTFVVGEDGVVELVDFPTISVNGIDYLKDPDKTYLIIKTPADNDTFTLLTGFTGSPNYTIKWGDGMSENITGTANPSHEYETAGMYLITISGNFENGIEYGFESNENKNKIIEVYGGSNYPLSIGSLSFSGCTSLTTANFPNAMSIGQRAFFNCTSLTTTNFPNATSIENVAFRNCTSLKELTLGNVTTTGTGTAFQDVKLINLTIAQDVTDADIDRIKTFYADNGGMFIGTETKHGLQVEKTPTADLDVVRKIDLADLAPDADEVAYNNTTSGLTAINVQDAIDEISASGGGGAEISPNGIDYLKDPDKTYLVIKTPADDDLFTLLTGTIGTPNYTIDWGDGTSEAVTTTQNPSHLYEKAGMYLITISGAFENGIHYLFTANENKNKIIKVYGGSNYPFAIKDNAFHGCTSLTTANFPNATSIGVGTFQNCSSLTTVNIPNTTIIGQLNFSNCTALTIANFPNVTTIGELAFRGCTSLTTANFPNAMVVVASAFRDCTSLKELTLGNVTTTGTGTRFENVKLVNLTIAQDVTETDIDRIKQFYSDNGGAFTGAQINSI